jgi:hypothetical protein
VYAHHYVCRMCVIRTRALLVPALSFAPNSEKLRKKDAHALGIHRGFIGLCFYGRS